ncbi:ABC transporter permease subunit [Brachybacterium hainanense]|uniref:Maltose/maltodextrin transport system permease protein n=1 Tax=Brachybacterium hainanense TaxID=1541174 RepID=A0ABV6RAX8_9MICO
MTPTHAPGRRAPRERSRGLLCQAARILLLGAVLAVTIWIVPVMIGQQSWLWLSVVLAAAIGIFVLYGTKRFVPAKYIFPGTFFLAVFLIVPIVVTIGYSFTNYGDGSRGTKEQAIAAITGNSVQQSADAPRYALAVAAEDGADEGAYVFYLVNPADGSVSRGSATEPLEPVPAGEATVTDGRVTAVDGARLLTPQEINEHYAELQEIAVEVDQDTAVRLLGVNQAFEGTKVLQYDEAADTITHTQTGEVYTVQKVGDSEYFVSESGERMSQSWVQNVGWANYARLFTDGKLAGQFVDAFVWTLVFAAGSVGLTFVVGFVLALVLDDERLRGRRLYRSILLMPYAVPGFIALLVWSNFYNRDFGLINQTLGLHLNWFGDPYLAKAAVLLTNLWMGFPYMFIVCTGALQAIPRDMLEAARIDGASRFQITWRVLAPLLLVAVAPLLVASFAFNFNNFNAIELLTGGGPFPANEYTRGATDILISMVYRIAFGGSGADFGFAAAVSVALFVLTGALAAIQFRFARVLEDVN